MKRIEKFNAKIENEARSLQILGAGFVLGGFTLVFLDLEDGVVAIAGMLAIGGGFGMLTLSKKALERLETRDD